MDVVKQPTPPVVTTTSSVIRRQINSTKACLNSSTRVLEKYTTSIFIVGYGGSEFLQNAGNNLHRLPQFELRSFFSIHFFPDVL